MFRITIQTNCGQSVVTLDGSLTDVDVEELHRLLLSVTAPAALNLSDLEIFSQAAVAELRQWLENGFVIERANPYVRMLLTKKTEQTASGIIK